MKKNAEFLTKAQHLTPKQIFDRINQEKKQLFVLNQEKILGKLKDVSKIRSLRRDIARLSTVLDQKVSEESNK